MRLINRWLLILFLLGASKAFAYPEFIGYGYSSCLTCHYNGLGNGALNDYGRALWAAEIAGKGFSNKSDEQLGEDSGFAGQKTPWWIKPAIKYRGLYEQRNVASPLMTEKFYQMQIDVNLALQFDPEGKYLFYYTYGYSPTPEEIGTNRISHFISREYFLRLEVVSTWWLYAGLMDRPFGIRNVDHTSYSRRYQDLTQKDQSLGVILHKVDPQYEIAVSATTGNPEVQEQVRRKGASLWSEWEFAELKRVGLSLSQDKTEFEKKSMVALHFRQQISSGSGFLFEYGLIDRTVDATRVKQAGSYNLIQGLLKIRRGHHLKATAERYNAEFKATSPDKWKFAFGLLSFPMMFLETRLEAVHIRDLSTQSVNDDEWKLQGQIHVSL